LSHLKREIKYEIFRNESTGKLVMNLITIFKLNVSEEKLNTSHPMTSRVASPFPFFCQYSFYYQHYITFKSGNNG